MATLTWTWKYVANRVSAEPTIDHSAQGCGAYTLQAPAKMATARAKYRSNQSERADQNKEMPTTPSDVPNSSAAKEYQSVIASAVQAIADRKNSLGRGKNETNMVGTSRLRSKDLRSPFTGHR